VGALYGAPLEATLRESGFQRVVFHQIPASEEGKNWEEFSQTCASLLHHFPDAGASPLVLLLGGGVVGDLGGFAAAVYRRGVPFVQVPTTLLAAVDSSVGGKVAVNFGGVKNIMGAFSQPRLVVCDLATLKTLPQRELRSGAAEVIKYGCILDAEFFNWLETNIEALLRRDRNALTEAVYRSCELKAQVVAADERETDRRAILNFGHTFGHAIEAGLGYGKWLHGEAVGCGMVIAANLSKELGGLSSEMVSRIVALIQRAALPIRPPRWPAKDYLEWMSHDKKSKSGKIRYVVLRSMGSAQTQIVDDGLISKVLEKAIA
jgi:3-dehydroquinate synthase